MKGIENMLKPMLGILNVAIPDSSPENDASKFMAELIEDYVPEDLPKELIKNFIVDIVNKNPNEFDVKLRELNMRMLHYFNRKPKDNAGL